jgi:phage-related protein
MATYSAGIASVSVTTVTGTYKDLNDFGFIVRTIRGVFDGRVANYPTAELPGRLDTAVLDTSATGSPRDVVVEGTVEAATIAALTTAIRDLTGWCARAVALKTVHDTASFLQVKQVTVSTTPPDMQGIVTAHPVTITFRAFDPLWYSTSLSAVSFSAATAMPLGTAPSKPVIRVTGAYTNPTITLKNSSAVTVGTMVFTVVLANAAHYIEIDCANRTIVHNTGSNADGSALLTSGNFLTLDPSDADTTVPTWPTLEAAVSAGSISSATSTFRKSYF